jgi:DNA-binding transcriptional regulator PaaX
MILRYGVDGANAILNAKERRLRRQEFERLRKRKLIEVSKEADCYRVALTQRGKQEAFRLKVLEADLLPDDRMCMVVFDIPESKRKLRKELRSFLTSAGFAPIQKSVWISRFDAGEALRELFRSTGASKWVRVYTAISG